MLLFSRRYYDLILLLSFLISYRVKRSLSLSTARQKEYQHYQHHQKQYQRQLSLVELYGSQREDEGEQRLHDRNQQEIDGIRLNKVFKATHSRRQADKLIDSGRVTVNGKPVTTKGGFKVIPFVDKIELDGKLIKGWEEMNAQKQPEKQLQQQQRKNPKHLQKQKHHNDKFQFEYVKYWKPRGVTCTTDRSIDGNIIDEIAYDGYKPKQRVYPVGRLDKDTSGLILLTSDGRLPNSALRGKYKQPKIYKVIVDKPIESQHVRKLREGVVITTVAQRDGNSRGKALTAKTLPCRVKRIQNSNNKGLYIELIEGRNRQIRKMLGALDYTVRELHRIRFMGLSLEPLQQPGQWTKLNNEEIQMLQNVILFAEEREKNNDN